MSYTPHHPGRVTAIVPGCNERFMGATIRDLLAQARGDVEILAILDGGPLPDATCPLPTDPRVRVIRHETLQGMRQSTNEAVQLATGEFLMKCDAHCRFGEGWDEILKADCDGDWIAVPTRQSLDGDTWAVRTRDYNYHYLTFPYSESMYGYGIHGKTFGQTENRAINRARAHLPVDDLMSFQGSCWFTPKASFLRLGPLDHEHYYFYAEAIELGMRQWASGGRVVINKQTWYAHLHKGNNNLHTIDGRVGRGFFLNLKGKRQSEAYATDFWLNNRWPQTMLSFEQFMARFDWLMARVQGDDRWPVDWADPKHRFDFLHRPAERIPAHI